MLTFLLAHWLAILLTGALAIAFAWLALIAAVWRKADEMHPPFD